jgi:hypothetical protein
MGGKASQTSWQSNKVQRTLSVTNDAWDRWTAAAASLGANRSELFEVLSRVAHQLDLQELRSEALKTLHEG